MAHRKYVQKSFSAFYDFNDDGGGIGFIDLNIGIGNNYSPITTTLHITRAFTSGGAPSIEFGTAADMLTGITFPVGTAVDFVLDLGIIQRITAQGAFGMTIGAAAITDGAGVFYMNYLQLEGTD